MIKKLAISVALLSYACSSYATEDAKWKVISHNVDSITYIDHTTVTNVDGIAKLWTRSVFKQPKKISLPRPVAYMTNRISFDCAQRTFSNGMVIFYDSDNDVLTTSAADPTAVDVPPGSIVEGEMRFAFAVSH